MTTGTVAPFTGAWIEIPKIRRSSAINTVAPFAGAWIEMCLSLFCVRMRYTSLPSRERGLKFPVRLAGIAQAFVAPFAGAWIEIGILCPPLYKWEVAPFAGARIEIAGGLAGPEPPQSLPSRERGLKLCV